MTGEHSGRSAATNECKTKQIFRLLQLTENWSLNTLKAFNSLVNFFTTQRSVQGGLPEYGQNP